MDREQYDIMYRAEGSHWWYRGMRRNTLALLQQFLAPGRTYSILDAGCGTGGTTEDLMRFGVVTGIDFSADALGYAASRGLRRLVCGSVERLPFADHTFDLVTSFDVIYHWGVADERAALAEFRRVLRPGGLALVRLPAFNWLRGAHDVAIHTQRRLTVGEPSARMREVGFEIVHATYANTMLFPLAVLKRTVDRFLPAAPADLTVPPTPVNLAFEAVLSLEVPIARRVGLPVGLSTVVLGRA